MPLFRRRKQVTREAEATSATWDIWNRAAMEGGGANPGPGDAALAALLRLHNEAMSSGLLHAVTEARTASQVDAALAGYRYFGLDDVASVVVSVRTEAANAAEDDLNHLEGEADSRYHALVPDDATLVAAFESKLATAPEAFAPPAP